jgi:uncharacterized protein YbaP (TraB family)
MKTLMKKLFLILCISTLLLNVCLAQSSVRKIEGKGHTVYIGGTIHLHGDDGILNLLKESGYNISQLS